MGAGPAPQWSGRPGPARCGCGAATAPPDTPVGITPSTVEGLRLPCQIPLGVSVALWSERPEWPAVPGGLPGRGAAGKAGVKRRLPGRADPRR
ncbi:hypothetical protein C0216_11355 [Streptomyces globosus]|uniref:Uncharacterized protein n=1 Tax=Streptomyces globosus TaxID=68209 RepID=A0A344TZA7_9ACTN|nr:hypothetical protein C0216_11355 [Streptomyces globosus]